MTVAIKFTSVYVALNLNCKLSVPHEMHKFMDEKGFL